MIFAEFYQKSAISEELVPACGDRSVFVLDGRQSSATHNADARVWGQKHGWRGYTLNKGETFTRSVVIQPLKVL